MFHQRDQRRHDDRHALARDGWQLKAETFAATGWHDAKRVFAGKDRFDHFLLAGAEFLEAEIAQPLFRLECVVCHSQSEWGRWFNVGL